MTTIIQDGYSRLEGWVFVRK